MKLGTPIGYTVRFVFMLLGAYMGTIMAFAQPARDVVDEDSLRQKVASTPNLKSQLSAKTKPLRSQAPVIESSLWRSSIILTDGEKFTLVPTGSILHLPPELRARVISKPEGDFMFWPAFLERNVSWLSAKEVTLTLSRGNAQEAKVLLKSLSGDSHLVVATYKGGPITILEPVSSRPGANEIRP
jgi:hypothetical protein